MNLPNPPQAEDDLVGTTLVGRYELLRHVGKGGMGSVYEAHDRKLGQRIAIKVLHPRLASSYRSLRRFQLEAQAAASTGHPNIVSVTDFDISPEGVAFLVLEYLEGLSLSDRLKQSKVLEPGELVPLIVQALSGLAAAHGQGIVHRDIKGSNIMLVPVPSLGTLVKVVDFGTAKLLENEDITQLTNDGSIVGTPTHMSPEQIRGLEIDGQSDLYSLGVVMFRTLTGQLPFKAKNIKDTLAKIVHDPTPRVRSLRPGIHKDLDQVVARAMAKNRRQRFQSAHDMAAALEPWMTGAGSVASSPATRGRPGSTSGSASLQITRDTTVETSQGDGTSANLSGTTGPESRAGWPGAQPTSAHETGPTSGAHPPAAARAPVEPVQVAGPIPPKPPVGPSPPRERRGLSNHAWLLVAFVVTLLVMTGAAVAGTILIGARPLSGSWDGEAETPGTRSRAAPDLAADSRTAPDLAPSSRAAPDLAPSSRGEADLTRPILLSRIEAAGWTVTHMSESNGGLVRLLNIGISRPPESAQVSLFAALTDADEHLVQNVLEVHAGGLEQVGEGVFHRGPSWLLHVSATPETESHSLAVLAELLGGQGPNPAGHQGS